jgi:hypothetical protein
MPLHYDPNQPRVPRGHSDGQWTDGNGGGPIKPAFAGVVARYAVGKTIEAALALYTWLSLRNSYDRQAIIAIRAREYRRSKSDPLKVEFVGYLNRDEVDKLCKRFEKTQGLTDAVAAKVKAEEPNLPPAVYGSRVHAALDHEIKAIGNEDFKSEVSILKGKDEGVDRKKGSIRIDVFDRTDNGKLVCVYDIKTGRRGLSEARIEEIKGKVVEAYGEATHFIITEMRPQVSRP